MLSESAQRKLDEIISLNMKAAFGDAEAFAARLELTCSMDGLPVEVPAFVTERVKVFEWTASDGSACFTMFPGAGVGERADGSLSACGAAVDSAVFSTAKHVLFWHGGGLVTEIGLPHWEFCVALVEQLGCSVTMPAYPLLPLHDWRRAHACLEAVYCNFLEKIAGEASVDSSAAAERIVLAGDSAGGLLAISLAQLCVANGWPNPQALITFSPMTDLSSEVDPAEKLALEADDPLIGFAGLGQVPLLWVPDEENRADFPPCVLFGPMADLPKQWLFAGSREALLPEMLEYARRVEEAGSSIVVDVREDLWHDYPLMLDMDEGREAFEQVLEIIRTL